MATSNTIPVVIPQPIAAQATSENINVIPNGATGTNGASFQEGFPAITRMPVIENPLPTQVSGLPPKQQDFNGLFNVVSQHNFFAQNGGTYSFNQAVSDAIGGYAKNQILWYFPANALPYPVVSMIDNNTYNFVETPSYIDGEKWKSIVANVDLSNIDATGQAKFDAKANTDLSNCTKPYVTETFRSGTEWYRLWSDGWIEQGGSDIIDSSHSKIINFMKHYENTPQIEVTLNGNITSNATTVNSGVAQLAGSATNVNGNGFTLIKTSNAYANGSYVWKAQGR